METKADARGHRKAAGIAAAFLVGVVLLLLVTLGALRLLLSEERVATRLEKEAGEAIEGEIEIGSFAWEGFPRGAILDDLVVKDPDGEEVLTADRVRVSLELGGVLGRTLRITRIEISGPTIRLVPGETQVYSIIEALTPARPVAEPLGEGWSVIVDEAVVTGARVEVELEQGLLVIEGLDLEGRDLNWIDGGLKLGADLFARAARLVLPGGEEIIVSGLGARNLAVLLPPDAGSEELIVSAERIEAEEVLAAGLRARIAEGALRYEESRFSFDEIVLDLMPGRMEITGELDLSLAEPSYEATISARGVGPARLLSDRVDSRLLPGGLDGRVTISGRGFSEPIVEAAASVVLSGLPEALTSALPEDVREALPSRADVEAVARIEPSRVLFESLTLRAQDIALDLSGQVLLDDGVSFDLTFRASHERLGSLFEALDAPLRAGSASLTGGVSGSLPLPEARALLVVEDIFSGPISAAGARVPLRLSGGVLYLEGARIESSRGVATATAEIALFDQDGDLEDEPSVRGRLELAEMDLSALDPTERFLGSLEGSFRLGGSLRAPTAVGVIRALDPSAMGVDFAVAEARVSLDASAFVVDEIVLAPTDGGRLVGSGRYVFETKEIEGRIVGSDIPAGLPFASLSGAPEIGGSASLELSVEGSPAQPRVFGLLEIDDLETGGELVHRGRLISRMAPLENGDYAIGVALPGALFVRIRLILGPPLRIEAWGDIEGFQLAWLFPGMVAAGVDARLEGEGEIRYRKDPPEVFGRLRLPSLDVTVAGETLSAREAVVLRYEAGTFILEDLDLDGPPGRFQAGGAVGEEIDLLAFGRLDAALLAAFVPSIVRAEGTIVVDLQASGSLERPQVSGVLGLAGPLRILPRGMLREVEVDTFSATLFGDRIDLDLLSGQVAGSPFFAQGYMILDDWRPGEVDLSFRGQGLTIRAADFVGEVNVDLRLTGEGERNLLSGTIDAVRGRYRRDLSFRGFSLIRQEPPGTPSEPSPLLDSLDLDLRVRSVGAIGARAEAGSFSVDLVLDADLRVGGRAESPRIEGRVAAARGVIRTPRAELPIVRGFIDFVPTQADPTRAFIDVLAEGEVLVPPGGRDPTTSYFLGLSLDGELDEISLDLVSQPPLDRLEILALLVTGQIAPRGLVPGDGRQVESALVFAGTRLAEPLTRMVTERLEEALNLELLVADVTPEGIAVTAGAELSRRIRLEGALRQGFGDAGAMALARVRFLLSNIVSLEAAVESVTEGAQSFSREREGSRSSIEIRVRVLGGR